MCSHEGLFTIQRVRSITPREVVLVTRFISYRQAAAVGVAVSGIEAVLSAATPDDPRRARVIARLAPPVLPSVAHLLALLAGLALVVLAPKLWQDSRFLSMNRQFDAALTQSHVAHLFKIYPGGHSSALWGAQAQHWLGIALDSLSSEARRGGR